MRSWPVVGVSLLLGACSWFGGGESTVEPPTPLVEFPQSATVSMLWSHDFGAGPGEKFVKLVPYLRAGVLYGTDTRGRVGAYDAASGRRLWETRLDAPVSGGVGMADDLILVGTRKGEVIALGRDNGERRWTGRVSSEILAPPSGDAGVVVVQTGDGRVFGLSVGNGERLWMQERTEPTLTLRGTSTPAVVAGGVLTGFASGKLAAIDLRDGHLLWEIPVAQPKGRSEIERLVDVDAKVLVAGSVLYAVAYQGKAMAIDLGSGRMLWSREVSSYTGMDIDTSNVYLSDARGHVLALDRESGATVWKQEKLAGRRLTVPVVVGDTVAVGDFEGYVHWLARRDGDFVARYRPTGAAIQASPVSDGDTLFVSAQNGRLAALKLHVN